MIDKSVVENLVNQWLEDKDYFLVDIEISRDDRIVVEIDHADGMNGWSILSRFSKNESVASYEARSTGCP